MNPVDHAVEAILNYKTEQASIPPHQIISFPLLHPVTNLTMATHDLLKKYITELRLQHLDKVKASIEQLWSELDIPYDERIGISIEGSVDDLDIEKVRFRMIWYSDQFFNFKKSISPS